MANEDEPQWWERQPEASADSSNSHSPVITDSSDGKKHSDTSKTKERGAFRGEPSPGFAQPIGGCTEGEEASHPMNMYERDLTNTMDPRPSSSGMIYNPPMISSHLGYLPHYPYGANSSFRQPYYPHMPSMMSTAGQPHMQGQYMPRDPQHGMPPHSHGALHSRDSEFSGMESDGYGLRSMRVPVDHLANKLGRTDLGGSQRPPSPQAMQPSSYGPSSAGHPTVGPSHGSYYPNSSAGMPSSNAYVPMPLSTHGIPQYSDMSMPPTYYGSFHQPPYGPSQYHPYHGPHFNPYSHPNFGRDFGASPPPRFPPGPEYYPPMHSSYLPRQPYPESPHRSVYRQSPQFFDVPSHPIESHSDEQMLDESSQPPKEYREEVNRRQRPTFFQKKSEIEDGKSDKGEQVEETLSSDDKLNFVSSNRRKSGNRRKCSVLSADSLENVVGSPVSPMTPSTPLSPEYKELSSISSSAPFSPTPPPSPAQGAIPKHSDSRQAVEAAKDLNHKVAALFRDVERVNAERRQKKDAGAYEASDESRSGRSSVTQSVSRSSASSSCERSSEVAELDKSENEHDVTRDSNESQYDNVPDSYPRIAPFPTAGAQIFNEKEEGVTSFRCDSPRVGDVGFVRATLDTPQTLLASTRLVQATLKPSPKPTTFFIALESKFVMPDFSEAAKSPDDKKNEENEDPLKSTPDTDGTIDKSTEEDRDLSIEQDSLMDDFSRDSKVLNADTSSISPDNVSVSPADYHESQLVMKHFVQNWDEFNSEKVPDDLDEFFLVLDCDGTASRYHFLSGSSSPRSSSSESFYGDDELEKYQHKPVTSSSVDKCEERANKPETYQPMETMLEEEEDLKKSLDLSLNIDVSTLPSHSQTSQAKSSTPIQRDPVPSASAVSPEIPHFSTFATAIKSSLTRNTNILGDALSKLHRSGEELSVPVLLGKSSDTSKAATAADLKPKPSPQPNQTESPTETSDERLSKPASSGTKSLLQSFLGSGKSFARPSPSRVALGNKPIVKPSAASGKSQSDNDTKSDKGGDRKLPAKLALPTFQTNVNFIFINAHMDSKKGDCLSKNFPKMEFTSKETKMTCFPNRESVKRRLFPEKNNNSSNCENIQLKKELSICLPKKCSKIPVKKSVFRSVSEGSRQEEKNFEGIRDVVGEKKCAQNMTGNSTRKDINKLEHLSTERNIERSKIKIENIQRTDEVSASSVQDKSVSHENSLCGLKENASCETSRSWNTNAEDGLVVNANNSCTSTTDADNETTLPAFAVSEVKLEVAQENENIQESNVNATKCNSADDSKPNVRQSSTCSNAGKDQVIKPKQKSKSQSSIPTLKQPRVPTSISRISLKTVPVQRNFGPSVAQSIEEQKQLKRSQKAPLNNQPLCTKAAAVTLQEKVDHSNSMDTSALSSLRRFVSEETESPNKTLAETRLGAHLQSGKFEANKKIPHVVSSTASEISKSKFGFEEHTKFQGDETKSESSKQAKPVTLKPTSIPMRKDTEHFSMLTKFTKNEVPKPSNLGANPSEACVVECIRKVEPLDITAATSLSNESNFSKETVKIGIVVLSHSLPCIYEERLESQRKFSSSLTKLDLWSNVCDEFVSKLLLSFVKEISYLDSVNIRPFSENSGSLNEGNTSTRQTSTLHNECALHPSELGSPRKQPRPSFCQELTSASVWPRTAASHLPCTCRKLENVAEGRHCSSDPSIRPVSVASCAMDVGSPPRGSSFLQMQKPVTNHVTTNCPTEGNVLLPVNNTNYGADFSLSKDKNYFHEVNMNNESCSQATKQVSGSSCSGRGGTVADDTGTSGATSSLLASEASVGCEASVLFPLEPAPVEQCQRSVPSCDLLFNVGVYSSDTSNAIAHPNAVTPENEFHLKVNDLSETEDSRNTYNNSLRCDSMACIRTSLQKINSNSNENLSKNFSTEDASSNDSGRGGYTIYTNRYIETSDVEISDDNISDFSDEEIVLSVSSEDLSDSKDDISEPLFIPSFSGTKLDCQFEENLSIEHVISETSANRIVKEDHDELPSFLTNSCNLYNVPHVQEHVTKNSQSLLETCASPILAGESRAVALDLVSHAAQSSSAKEAMEGLPFLKREELDRLATIIANKLLQSNPNSLTTSVASTDGSADAVMFKNILSSTNPQTLSADSRLIDENKSGKNAPVELENNSTNFLVENHSNLTNQSYPLTSVTSLSIETEPFLVNFACEKNACHFDSSFLAADSSLSPSDSIAGSAASGTDSNCGAGPYLTALDGPASVSSGDSVCVSSGYSVSSSDSGVSVNSTDKMTSSLDSATKKAAKIHSEQIGVWNLNDISQSPEKRNKRVTNVEGEIPEMSISTKSIAKMEDRRGVLEKKPGEFYVKRGSDSSTGENHSASTGGNHYPGNTVVARSRACVIQGDRAEREARGHVSDSGVDLMNSTSGNLSLPISQCSTNNHLKSLNGERTREKSISHEHERTTESCQEHDLISTIHDLKNKLMRGDSEVPSYETNSEDISALEAPRSFLPLAKEIVVCEPGEKSVCEAAYNLKVNDETHASFTNDNNTVLLSPVSTSTSLACYDPSPKKKYGKNYSIFSAAASKNRRTNSNCTHAIEEKIASTENVSPPFVRHVVRDDVSCAVESSVQLPSPGNFVCESSSKGLRLQSSPYQDCARYFPLSLTELAARAHKNHLVQVYSQGEKTTYGKNSEFDARFCSPLTVPKCLNQEDNIDSGFESVTKLSSFSAPDCEPRSQRSFILSSEDIKSVSSLQSPALESTNVVHETQSAGIKLNKRENGLAHVSLGAQVANRSNLCGSCGDGDKLSSFNNPCSMLKNDPQLLSPSLKGKNNYVLLTKGALRGKQSVREKILDEMFEESISDSSAGKTCDYALENESNSHQPGCAFTDEQTDVSTARQSSMEQDFLTGEAETNIVCSNERVQFVRQQEEIFEHNFVQNMSKSVSTRIPDESLEDPSLNVKCGEANEEESISSITSTIRIPMGKIESLVTDSGSRKKVTDLKGSKSSVTHCASSKPAVIGKCERERLKVLSSDHCAGKLATVEIEGKSYFGSVVHRNLNDDTKEDIIHSDLNCYEHDLSAAERLKSSGMKQAICMSNSSVCDSRFSDGNENFKLQKIDVNNAKMSVSRRSAAIDVFPKMKNYQPLQQKNYNTINNFISMSERSREELDKSDESFEEINWEVENDPIRKISYEMDKPDRKISDSSGVSSLSSSSYRKLSTSSNVSSLNDDWHWFPGRKSSFQCEQNCRKISAASSGCSSGISSLQELQDGRRISVCSGISNLQRIREESSSHFSESSGSEGDLNLLDDKAESPDGALPAPPPPVWPTFTDQKPPKPPRRSTLGILYDNNTVRFDELQVRNCSSLKRDKRLSQKRDRRRTLHTFNNIFDEWHQQHSAEGGLSGSLEMVKSQNAKDDPIKSSSEAGLLDNDDVNSFQQNRNECGTSPSLIGAYDSCESVQASEAPSSRKIGYFEPNDSDSDDSDCTGEMYSIRVQHDSNHFSNEKSPLKRRGIRNSNAKRPLRACNEEIPKPSGHSELNKLKSRDARSLPNLSDVGEANVLDDPVIPERKNRKHGHTILHSNFEVLKSKAHINRSELNISELHTAAERLQGRVKHALSDDAILEKGYAEYSGSEHESDMEDLNMQFFEPKSKLRVSLPRRQPSKQSKRSQRFHQLKRKFSFNSIDKSKELKDSISTSLQRFKTAKNKFEKLVSKSLKREREAPSLPSLVRASRILSAPTDRCRYAFDDLSHSSSGASHYDHNLSNSTSFNSNTTSTSKNSLGVPPEGFNVTRTYRKVSEVRHYEPRSLNGSESSYSWDDADSDFEYFKVAPGTVLVSLEHGSVMKYSASGASQWGGSLGRRRGCGMTRSLSEPPELRSSYNAQAHESVTAGMIPSGAYRSEGLAVSPGAETHDPAQAQVAPSSPPSDVLAWILQQNSMR